MSATPLPYKETLTNDDIQDALAEVRAAETFRTCFPEPIRQMPLALRPTLLVWWLTQDDYHGFQPHQERNPLRIPDYVWTQFCRAAGRAGRGRLWVPSHIPIDELPVAANDPRWTPELLRSAGIVIEAADADACLRWGGKVTTLTLDTVEAKPA